MGGGILLFLLGGVVAILSLVLLMLNGKEDLSIWHEVRLEKEFEAGSEVETFSQYLALEEELFRELDEKILSSDEVASGRMRYSPGSPANPSSYRVNWNRTFEWKPIGKAKGGVVLLHGMSDSPYSLRHIGKLLRDEGFHVIGLRLPGHGTAPSGLKYFAWEDMESALNLTVRHLDEEIGEAPLFLIGYSNGGALAVHYGCESVRNDALPKVEGIVLCSPAVGVSPAAALAVWQRRLGHILGMEKLAWTGVGPEYDPFKYVSFAVNAGVQVRDLTVEIRKDLAELKSQQLLGEYPSVLAFQSIVDATVSTPALIDVLFGELPSNDHELVLFDINHRPGIDSILKNDPFEATKGLIESTAKTYSLSFVSNRKSEDEVVRVYHYAEDRGVAEMRAWEGNWPEGLYSLSHIAIPFPETDELYGSHPGDNKTGYHIGSVALRGERGALSISASDQLRLRYNPFFPLLERRILERLGGGPFE
ncbi:MAG: alpha/beta hydrolase [Verrucomicrobiota bacterium]